MASSLSEWNYESDSINPVSPSSETKIYRSSVFISSSLLNITLLIAVGVLSWKHLEALNENKNLRHEKQTLSITLEELKNNYKTQDSERNIPSNEIVQDERNPAEGNEDCSHEKIIRLENELNVQKRKIEELEMRGKQRSSDLHDIEAQNDELKTRLRRHITCKNEMYKESKKQEKERDLLKVKAIFVENELAHLKKAMKKTEIEKDLLMAMMDTKITEMNKSRTYTTMLEGAIVNELHEKKERLKLCPESSRQEILAIDHLVLSANYFKAYSPDDTFSEILDEIWEQAYPQAPSRSSTTSNPSSIGNGKFTPRYNDECIPPHVSKFSSSHCSHSATPSSRSETAIHRIIYAEQTEMEFS